MEKLYSIENFDRGGQCKNINSPRSLEACLRTGIYPAEFRLRDRKSFPRKNLTPEMIDLQYNSYLSQRDMKIQMVTHERKKIIAYAQAKANFKANYDDEDAPTFANVTTVDKTSVMVELEMKRIEALKRRQEKDLAKTIEKEQMAVTLQLKIVKAEEEEMKKQKAHIKKVAEQKKIEEKKKAVNGIGREEK